MLHRPDRFTGPMVPSLTHQGVPADCDLVFRHLVMFGPDTSVRLSTSLGMPQRRVAAALDELHEIGAVTTTRDAVRTGGRWTARPPAEVIEGLRRRRRRARAVPPHRVDLPTVLGIAAARSSPELGVRHLASRELTRIRLGELALVAGSEYLAMHPEQVFDAESIRAAAPLDRAVIARGVRMRLLGVQPVDADPIPVQADLPSRLRPRYRMLPSIPTKLLLIDRKVAFLPASADDLEQGYLELTNPLLVLALVSIFERHWSLAPKAPECVVPQITLTDREQALITLLAEGHTDATAARRMRISPRSVSTILRNLMDRVGVDNRFQLGLALGAARVAPLPPPTSTRFPIKETD